VSAEKIISADTLETEAPETPKKDDLTKIEGIGKKIAEILTVSGIASFEILSKTTSKKLRAILDEAGNKFKTHDPSTWPKQAKLASAGKWAELKKLQAELKA
jgi:predicted flap endonuclease-1-like 5' DNA nuclease